ncbi:MAG: class II fumarate hydratase [Lachnospiraceae bacterium]|nr:class II fumarate hydratase [Lachnospiraceae bacterium]
MDNKTEGFRIEHDSMGEMKVPSDRYWGAQTQRSRENFRIGVGEEPMPERIIEAFAILKKAAAKANHKLVPERMTKEKCDAICDACDRIGEGKLKEEFPLVVWQTGSGTQSNMNVNEVIAGYENCLAGRKLLHPNDDVNMSQSSNDTFPTALHIAAVLLVENTLIPAAAALADTLQSLEEENKGLVKSGRTHLQDAVPISFSQEISGWRTSVEKDISLLKLAVEPLKELALGGTAVGTGLNAPEGFAQLVAEEAAFLTGTGFVSAPNKFHALTSRDEIVFAHGALKALAADMMKIANDVRWLSSGPRCGLGEITIPANEPGSSIMPGKVNPTQCEQVTMVAVQVMGNDAAIGFAASQGNFELNVFLPVIAYNFIQSARLLSESILSFTENCVKGIKPVKEKMHENLHRSLMLTTALNPYIGYENAAKVAHRAFEENISLKEACLQLGFLSSERFDEVFHPEEMAKE